MRPSLSALALSQIPEGNSCSPGLSEVLPIKLLPFVNRFVQVQSTNIFRYRRVKRVNRIDVVRVSHLRKRQGWTKVETRVKLGLQVQQAVCTDSQYVFSTVQFYITLATVLVNLLPKRDLNTLLKSPYNTKYFVVYVNNKSVHNFQDNSQVRQQNPTATTTTRR